jgi:hypothetical protein
MWHGEMGKERRRVLLSRVGRGKSCDEGAVGLAAGDSPSQRSTRHSSHCTQPPLLYPIAANPCDNIKVHISFMVL